MNQQKLNVRVEDEQLALIAEIADKARAAAMEGVQPDLFENRLSSGRLSMAGPEKRRSGEPKSLILQGNQNTDGDI